METRWERAELLNGRVAMLGVMAALGAYAVTGQLIPGVFQVRKVGPCFMLVASVIGVQLAIVSGTLVGCFITRNDMDGASGSRCSGEGIQEIMMYISAQTFALYAAEKK